MKLQLTSCSLALKKPHRAPLKTQYPIEARYRFQQRDTAILSEVATGQVETPSFVSVEFWSGA